MYEVTMELTDGLDVLYDLQAGSHPEGVQSMDRTLMSLSDTRDTDNTDIPDGPHAASVITTVSVMSTEPTRDIKTEPHDTLFMEIETTFEDSTCMPEIKVKTEPQDFLFFNAIESCDNHNTPQQLAEVIKTECVVLKTEDHTSAVREGITEMNSYSDSCFVNPQIYTTVIPSPDMTAFSTLYPNSLCVNQQDHPVTTDESEAIDVKLVPQIDVKPTPQTDVKPVPQTDVMLPQTDVAPTPQTDMIVIPQTDVMPTPQNDVAQTLQTDLKPTPQTDVNPTPQTDVKPAPQTDVNLTPQTDVNPTPQTDVRPTPQTDVNPTPQTDVNPTPQTDVNLTPQADVRPAPQTDVNPTPQTDVNPTPQTDVNLTPQADVRPAPQTDVNPTPQTDVNPTPQTDVKPTPQIDVNPTPQTDVNPTPQTDVKPTPQTLFVNLHNYPVIQGIWDCGDKRRTSCAVDILMPEGNPTLSQKGRTCQPGLTQQIDFRSEDDMVELESGYEPSDCDDTDVNDSDKPVQYRVPSELNLICDKEHQDGVVSSTWKTTRASSEITQPSSSSIIDITVAETDNSSGRSWDRKNYCLFCEKGFAKIARHIRTIHKDENEVKELKKVLDMRKRKDMLGLLKNRGNHKHNCEVLRNQQGTLIVAYRPKGNVSPLNYIPCQFCLGYYARLSLWKHSWRCSAAPERKAKYRSSVASGKLLLPSPKGTSIQLNTVLSTMKSDDISRVVKSDPLILSLGEKLYLKNGHDKEQFCLIRNCLREAGRLLKQLREQNSLPDANLQQFIDPVRFHDVVHAARTESGFCDSSLQYKTPSLALKLGHTIKKCAKIVRAKCLQNGDEILQKKSEKFLDLVEKNWTEEVSIDALRTLYDNKRNKVKLIPLTQDVAKMTNYLKDMGGKAYNQLKENPNNVEAWSTLNECCLTQIVLFNRRRQEEASKMKIADYTGKHQVDGQRAVMDCLSPLEQKLVTSLHRIEIVSIRGGTVPVLLTATMCSWIEALICSRTEVGVHQQNEFVFARRSKGSQGHIRGSDCLRKISVMCEAEKPALLRSTRLRKQIATVSQILNLKDSELDILANLLGHDIGVHGEIDFLSKETLQVAKVSKLLISMERGEVRNRLNLNEIEVDPDEEIEEDLSDDENYGEDVGIWDCGDIRRPTSVVDILMPEGNPTLSRKGRTCKPGLTQQIEFHSEGDLVESKSECEPSGCDHRAVSDSYKPAEYPVLSEVNPICDNDNHQGEIVSSTWKRTRASSEIPQPCSSSIMDITVAETDNSSGKSWDRKNFCPFCEKGFAKIARHILTIHKDENEVRELEKVLDKRKRKDMLGLLKSRGNHKHNCEVLRNQQGTLIVAYRPKEKVSPLDYIPCQFCLGYYARLSLWKHSSRCPAASERKAKYRSCVAAGKLLLPPPNGTSLQLNVVLSTMKSDDISRVVESDPLILSLGEKLYLKNGHDKEQFCLIRNCLREAGRLLKQLREQHSLPDANLQQFIDPVRFHDVVHAARTESGFCDSSLQYKTPSLALKLGHTIKKCAKIVRAKCLQNGNGILQKKSEKFLDLVEKKWTEEVSIDALRTLYHNKRNKVKLIPLTQDVAKMTNYLKGMGGKAYNQLKENPNNVEAWSTLNECCLTEIILFNRRRQEEASKMKIADYTEKHQVDGQRAVMDCLSPLEQKLVTSLHRIEIVSIRGGTVPVLLTATMCSWIEALICSRTEVGVHQQNEFVFARPSKASQGHILGSDCLRKISVMCEAGRPMLLRSTRLRKQIASVSQILNLKDNELDILANLLGHDIGVLVHDIGVHRLSEETLQVAKLTKLLISMERGEVLKGFSLEINVDPDEEIEEDPSEDENDDEDVGNGFNIPSPGLSGKRKMISEQTKDFPSESKKRKKAAQKFQGGQVRKQPWTEQEKAAVMRHFTYHISSLKLPVKREADQCISSEKSLSKRSWRNVKDFVRHQIRMKQKISIVGTTY